MGKKKAPKSEVPNLGDFLASVQQAGGRLTPVVRTIITQLYASEKAYPLQQFQGLIREKLGYEISLSTIYRMIQRLSRNGVLSSMQRQDGEVVYFLCKGSNKHHHHFLCTQCHKVQDAMICHEKFYQKFLTESLGAQMTYHAIQFEGLCQECQKKRA
ncbi:MAG TPA: transcriptional repressor [Fibrobacteraceae bacterium]|nr:transcriptional repressor [Fibrobacteraceae bacterium]